MYSSVILLVLVSLSLGSVTATPLSVKEVKDDGLNHYIDLVLSNLQILMVENNFDPMPLPNATTGFSDTVLGVVWHGEASIYDGWLHGMATMFRAGDADFLYDETNGHVIGLKSELGIGAMQAHYKLLAKFMDLGPIADVTVDINGVSVYFESSLEKEECVFQVQKIEVTHIGLINVDVSGLGVLNWIVEIVSELVVNTIKFVIENTIENAIVGIMNKALGLVNLGIIGDVLGCTPATTAAAMLA